MSTVSAPPVPVKANRPRQRKPLAPVQGTVKLLLPVGTVNDRTGKVLIVAETLRGPVTTECYLELTGCGYRLTGWDAQAGAVKVYDLPLTLDSCDCPDATYASERPGGCKHQKALRKLLADGRIPAAQDEVSVPDEADLGEPCGQWFPEEAA